MRPGLLNFRPNPACFLLSKFGPSSCGALLGIQVDRDCEDVKSKCLGYHAVLTNEQYKAKKYVDYREFGNLCRGMEAVLRRLKLKKGSSSQDTEARKRLQQDLFAFDKVSLVGIVCCIRKCKVS